MIIEMEYADLHIHSTASDGMLKPEEVIDWAIKKGLKAISITDHDDVSQIETSLEYASKKGFELIPGIELSTEYSGTEVHMLGYFFNYKDKELIDFLNKLKDSRTERAKKMVKKLNNLGYNIDFEDIKDNKTIGRPHIAREMIKKGYCKSMEEVFDRFLGYGKAAYVERYKLSPFEALEKIKKCGGVVSLAHPGLIEHINKEVLIKRLVDWGLDGIEVYHTKHTKQDVEYFERLVNKYNLIPTGGSDCHGDLVDGEPRLGDTTIPYNSVTMLKKLSYNNIKR